MVDPELSGPLFPHRPTKSTKNAVKWFLSEEQLGSKDAPTHGGSKNSRVWLDTGSPRRGQARQELRLGSQSRGSGARSATLRRREYE